MSEALPNAQSPAPSANRTASLSSATPSTAKKSPDAVACERCGTEMFRMHAVWRCPNCGFKTDCCGW